MITLAQWIEYKAGRGLRGTRTNFESPLRGLPASVGDIWGE